MNVDWIAGHHLLGNTRCRTRGCGTRVRTPWQLLGWQLRWRRRYMRKRDNYIYTLCTRSHHTHGAHTSRIYTPRASRARKSIRIPGNRLRCAVPAGIEFIIPLGTAPLPDHFRVFAFHGTDRHVPIEPVRCDSFSISHYFRHRCASRIRKFPDISNDIFSATWFLHYERKKMVAKMITVI